MATLFYTENFEDIKEVVEEMIGDGVLFTNEQRSIVVEGVRVGREAVLGANVVLTGSSKIIKAKSLTRDF